MSERQSRYVFVAAAVSLLVLMAAQIQRPGGGTALGHALRVATAPLVRTVLGVARGVSGLWHGYIDLVGVRADRDRLAARVARLEQERQRYEEVFRENRRLRELLDLRGDAGWGEGVVARVIGTVPGGPLRRALLVDRGSSSGVARDWVAVHRGALVGRVVEVTGSTAEVRLILDPDSGVAVRHEADRYAGILRGGNAGTAHLDYVPRFRPVSVGDALVTSGLDGVFPPGLLVGHVRELFADSPLTWGIEVEVAFDPDRLEELLLIPPLGGGPGSADGADPMRRRAPR
ncbi:MAG: rod shape-determining protein MreC [Acidobacteria bacterium]|nr:MAG: rod shape-determining protein MreC [Acidobacteriota bacterium]